LVEAPSTPRLVVGTSAVQAFGAGFRDQPHSDGTVAVLVTAVEGGSAAAAAGLRAGDVVTAIGGAAIADLSALGRAIPTEGPVTFTVSRGEETVDISLGG
ncbi:PDZ domain-containing protein, partial [Brevundimonas sp.]|uniref:PDZ domain-containing protein n=1 Tax=Brevundimonas sp. TaxID=1871086 RepID=UPI002AB90AF1